MVKRQKTKYNSHDEELAQLRAKVEALEKAANNKKADDYVMDRFRKHSSRITNVHHNVTVGTGRLTDLERAQEMFKLQQEQFNRHTDARLKQQHEYDQHLHDMFTEVMEFYR
jgi:hypothetical protein